MLQHICNRQAAYMHHVCSYHMYAVYVQHTGRVHAIYMQHACSMRATYMQRVCTVHMQHVHSMACSMACSMNGSRTLRHVWQCTPQRSCSIPRQQVYSLHAVCVAGSNMQRTCSAHCHPIACKEAHNVPCSRWRVAASLRR